MGHRVRFRLASLIWDVVHRKLSELLFRAEFQSPVTMSQSPSKMPSQPCSCSPAFEPRIGQGWTCLAMLRKVVFGRLAGYDLPSLLAKRQTKAPSTIHASVPLPGLLQPQAVWEILDNTGGHWIGNSGSRKDPDARTFRQYLGLEGSLTQAALGL